MTMLLPLLLLLEQWRLGDGEAAFSRRSTPRIEDPKHHFLPPVAARGRRLRRQMELTS